MRNICLDDGYYWSFAYNTQMLTRKHCTIGRVRFSIYICSSSCLVFAFALLQMNELTNRNKKSAGERRAFVRWLLRLNHPQLGIRNDVWLDWFFIALLFATYNLVNYRRFAYCMRYAGFCVCSVWVGMGGGGFGYIEGTGLAHSRNKLTGWDG